MMDCDIDNIVAKKTPLPTASHPGNQLNPREEPSATMLQKL